jgi:tetratricopeptide (TPR) repeat protein
MKPAILCGVLLAAGAAPILAAGWTDRGEYDLALAIRVEAAPQKQLALLDQWKSRYPHSALRQARRELYLAAYYSLGDRVGMLDTAQEMLTDQRDDLVGAYWGVTLIPGAKNPSRELWDIGEAAANRLLAPLPAGGEWQKEKDSLAWLAHRVLGWIQWQRGNYPAAEAEFATCLAKDPKNAEISAWFGMALADQKSPEKVVPALWLLARAGSLKGEGALPDEQRRQMNGLAERIYISYHGSTDGLDRLRSESLASAVSPADFRIESAAAVAARKADEELRRTNPQLATWMSIRKQLEGPDGDKYFAETLRPAPLPKLKGSVIRCAPERKPTEVGLGLSGGSAEEVVLMVHPALPFAAVTGTEIEFEGMADSYSRGPFRLTVKVDKEKITGWPQKPAPHRR